MTILSESCVTVTLIFIFVSLVAVVESQIMCHQCHSQIHHDCRNLVNSTAYLKPCEHNGTEEVFCRKIVQRIYPRDKLDIVIRKCGWVKHKTQDCYTGRNVDRSQVVCQCFEEGCNSGPLRWHIPSALLVASLATSVAMST